MLREGRWDSITEVNDGERERERGGGDIQQRDIPKLTMRDQLINNFTQRLSTKRVSWGELWPGAAVAHFS